jgi:hypothetical protein
MQSMRAFFLACMASFQLLVSSIGYAQAALPSWTEGPSKKAVLELVARVTKQGGPDYVVPAERIATFDNDGTLWAEQPRSEAQAKGWTVVNMKRDRKSIFGFEAK